MSEPRPHVAAEASQHRQTLARYNGGIPLAWFTVGTLSFLAHVAGLEGVSRLVAGGVGIPLTCLTPIAWPLVWLGHAWFSWTAPRETTRRELAHAAALAVPPACVALFALLSEDRLTALLEDSPLFPQAGWLGVAGSLWLLLAGACFFLRTLTPGWRMPWPPVEPPPRELG